jgi:poly-gamma-glutamate synthesis protein (capsule biosynthesis protein)
MLVLAACGGVDPAAPATGAATLAAPMAVAGAAAGPASAAVAPATGAARGPAARCAPGVPAAACAAPGLRVCEAGAADRAGEWRYALIAGPFEPTLDVTADRLAAAWRTGAIAASAESEAALAGALGARGRGPRLAPGERPRPEGARWAIVPAHELLPSWSVVTVDGRHPLADGGGPLAVALCGPARGAIRNIDPAHLTALVMSGTTALTGRTAAQIDGAGVAEMIRYIQPFFRSADLVHISNEVSFVRRCDPSTGQSAKELKFCARDRYIELLEALGTRIVELTGSHLTDHGTRSLERTIDQYQKRGWIWFGGGRTQLDATEPRLVEDHGNRLAFVGCNAVNWWIHAIRPGPGTANCDWARMVWQIQDLRRRGYTPIATVQHRELRTHAPPPDLVRDLRRLAEAGAAFVLGSQAHVAHPWDVHHGAYVHYGPGNILFAQHREMQRDATVDKLYFHEGKLLSVAHLFTRTEHGQPRLQADDERASFLGELAAAAAAIAPPDPWAVPALPPESRARPDSLVVRGISQPLAVTVPERIAPGGRYALTIDLTAAAPAAAAAAAAAASAPATTAAAGAAAVPPDAFLVVRTGKPIATGDEIAAFMRAKYPIDPARVTITPAPKPKPAKRSRRHHREHR